MFNLTEKSVTLSGAKSTKLAQNHYGYPQMQKIHETFQLNKKKSKPICSILLVRQRTTVPISCFFRNKERRQLHLTVNSRFNDFRVEWKERYETKETEQGENEMKHGQSVPRAFGRKFFPVKKSERMCARKSERKKRTRIWFYIERENVDFRVFISRVK